MRFDQNYSSYSYKSLTRLWNIAYIIFLKMQDQTRAISMIESDPELSSLSVVQAPLVDVEIRGVPALQFLGDIVWK